MFFALIGYNWLKLISRFGLPVKVAGIVYLFWVLVHTPVRVTGRWRRSIFMSILAGDMFWLRCG